MSKEKLVDQTDLDETMNPEKLTEKEEKVFRFFKQYIEVHEKEMREAVDSHDFLKSSTKDLIVREYLEHYIENKLPGEIYLKLEERGISEVREELILKKIKKAFIKEKKWSWDA